METHLQQQPQELLLPSGKSKLEMAELLLKQNTLCFQLMLQNQINQPENFPNYDMSLLEGTVRNNHLLTYNLIMSYVSEDYSQKAQEELNEVIEIQPNNNEPSSQIIQDLQEQQQPQQIQQAQVMQQPQVQVQVLQQDEVREEQKVQQEEEKKQNEDEVVQIESFYDDLFFYDFCDDRGNCCICLSKYRSNSTLRQLPCNHSFHRACIDKWLKKSSKCPFCRKNVGGP